jgi:hypothetical protein
MRGFSAVMAALVAPFMFVLAGCEAPSIERQMGKVKGTATLDGKPIEDGMVYLKHPEKGTVSSVPIKNGAFEGEADVGTMRVELAAYRMVTPKTDMAGYNPEPSKENYLPMQYHLESKITADVKAEGVTELKYDMKSQ